jgi:hypothetical protein
MSAPSVPQQLRALAAKARQHANPITLSEVLADGFEVLAASVEAGQTAPAPAPAAASKTPTRKR